jgi:hypothetical protein
MNATVSQTKTATTLDLSIRTLKPRSAADASDSRDTQSARVVIVTSV